MQLLPINCSQIEFVKRRGQSLLSLEIDPIEKSFFRICNAIGTMPCALRVKAPVKFLCNVTIRLLYRSIVGLVFVFAIPRWST